MSQDNPYSSIVDAALGAQQAASEKALADQKDIAARNLRVATETDEIVKRVISEARKANDALNKTDYRLTVKEHPAVMHGMLSGVELQLTRHGAPFHSAFHFAPGGTMKMIRMRPEGIGKGTNPPEDLTQLFDLSAGSQFGEAEACDLVSRIVKQINPDVPSITDQLHDLKSRPIHLGRTTR